MKKREVVQLIRLGDVFIVAPVIIAASYNKGHSKPMRTTLRVIGYATLMYNAVNFINDLR